MTRPILHHPDGATLMSYAAATLPEALSAVVAAHVAMCPECQRAVADLELLGSAILLSSAADAKAAALEVPPKPVERRPVRRASVGAAGRLPAPIAETYGLSMDTIPWKRLGPGVWHHRLALRQAGEGDLRLIRIAPGRAMPDHGHGGAELTLVLEGAYSDVTGRYGRGDLQDLDESIEHQPIVDKGSDCICLIASEHPARFKSFFGRLLQPWTGM